jgi:hypothetical protein
VLWLRLRDGGGTWPEYADFLARNGNWPGLALVRTRAEQAMPAGLPAEAVIAFFATEAPRTGAGALRHADALMTSGRNDDAEAEIVRAWRELSMTGSEQNAILARYEAALAPHHVARLDNMLWRGLTAEAENMLPLVEADWQALGRARIGLRRDVDGTTALINAVPRRCNPTRAWPTSVTSGGCARAAGTMPRPSCCSTRPRPRRWAGRNCGWSAARISPARRCAAATSTPPTGSPRRTSAAPARPMRIPNGWPATSR